jgi:hypothetical protein
MTKIQQAENFDGKLDHKSNLSLICQVIEKITVIPVDQGR